MTEAAHRTAARCRLGKRISRLCWYCCCIPKHTDNSGNLLEAGEIKETRTSLGYYENNDKANAEGFTNGWFRTATTGHDDGVDEVTLTGRLKERSIGGENLTKCEA
jgi:hypothetical protein